MKGRLEKALAPSLPTPFLSYLIHLHPGLLPSLCTAGENLAYQARDISISGFSSFSVFSSFFFFLSFVKTANEWVSARNVWGGWCEYSFSSDREDGECDRCQKTEKNNNKTGLKTTKTTKPCKFTESLGIGRWQSRLKVWGYFVVVVIVDDDPLLVLHPDLDLVFLGYLGYIYCLFWFLVLFLVLILLILLTSFSLFLVLTLFLYCSCSLYCSCLSCLLNLHHNLDYYCPGTWPTNQVQLTIIPRTRMW